jgi:uncharacterized membrane protein (UPF0127 family)
MIININKNKFNVKTVFSSKHTQNGMMGKKFDDNFNGMLFLMSDGPHCFWMKNCIIPLDIIYIKDNTISKIFHNCPPCKTKECENYCSEGDMILELQGGTCKELGIKSGNKIISDLD